VLNRSEGEDIQLTAKPWPTHPGSGDPRYSSAPGESRVQSECGTRSSVMAPSRTSSRTDMLSSSIRLARRRLSLASLSSF